MKGKHRPIALIENDLYWANHTAQHGTTPEQRKRGRDRVERFTAELEAAKQALQSNGNPTT